MPEASLIPLLIIGIVTLTIALWAASEWYCGIIGRAILADWAEKTGWQMVSIERRLFRRGPFWFWIGFGHPVVFRATMSTPAGERRTGFFRVEVRLLGFATGRIDAKWD